MGWKNGGVDDASAWSIICEGGGCSIVVVLRRKIGVRG